jgi:hypothetical protein
VFAEICRDGAGSEAEIYPDASVVEESWRAEVESECRATSGAASEERPSIGAIADVRKSNAILDLGQMVRDRQGRF